MQTVDQWLTDLGLKDLGRVFRKHSVDMQSVMLLTEDDLREMGLALGPRKILAQAISSLNRTPQAELRFVTILFGDLVGSTEMSRTLGLEDYEAILARFRDSTHKVISQFGGHVADFAGDGVVAYFGWPEATENQAEQALRAALAIHMAMQDTPVRIGVSSGDVLAGSTKIGRENERMIATGETPNRAARLQSTARPGQVLVDSQTHDLLRDRFTFEQASKIVAKGYDYPLACWMLTGERQISTEAYANPMVEREDELAQLFVAWKRARIGQGALISLSGGAGCGKSRLVAALLNRADVAEADLIRFNFAPQNTLSAFDAILTGLRTFSSKAGLNGEADSGLGQLLSGDLLGSSELSAQERRRVFISTFVTSLRNLAKERSLLIIAEDLHWADPSSLDVLRQIAVRIGETKQLVVTTQRAETGSERLAETSTSVLRLGGLSDTAIAKLAQNVATRRLQKDEIQQIVQRSDGIPLYAEQLTLALVEGADKAAGGLVPASLRAALLSRLDSLGMVKDVALAASVIGRRFSEDALFAVSGVGESRVLSDLKTLEITGLIQREKESFQFSHALVRDAAYGSLLRDRRRAMHKRMASWLEYSDPQGRPEVQAHHYQEAADHPKAAQKWEIAAEAARLRHAQIEAAELYSRALEQDKIATDGLRELDLLIHLGEAHFASRGGAAEITQSTFRRAIKLAEIEGKTRQQSTALYGVWIGKMITGSHQAAMECAEQMFALADQSGDGAIRIAAYRVRCAPRCLSADLDGAIADAEAALQLAADHETQALADFAHDPLATLVPTFAQAIWAKGETKQALSMAQQSVAESVACGHSVNTVCYVRLWEMILLAQSRKADALECAALHLQDFASRTGSAFWENLAKWGLGYSRVLNGQSVEGTAIAQKSVQGFMSSGARQQAPLFLLTTFEGALKCGNLETGHKLIDEAEHVIKTTEQNYFVPLLLKSKIALMTAVGDQISADRLRERKLEMIHKMGAFGWLPGD